MQSGLLNKTQKVALIRCSACAGKQVGAGGVGERDEEYGGDRKRLVGGPQGHPGSPFLLHSKAILLNYYCCNRLLYFMYKDVEWVCVYMCIHIPYYFIYFVYCLSVINTVIIIIIITIITTPPFSFSFLFFLVG